MIAQAHAHGMKVLVIPHLWVETGGWRGEIESGSPAGWAAYQASYRHFVVAWARDAQAAGADALSIGVECKSWSGRFGGYWRSLIDELRTVFDGLLTYSANWDEVDGVLFWDQLDRRARPGRRVGSGAADRAMSCDATHATRTAVRRNRRVGLPIP